MTNPIIRLLFQNIVCFSQDVVQNDHLARVRIIVQIYDQHIVNVFGRLFLSRDPPHIQLDAWGGGHSILCYVTMWVQKAFLWGLFTSSFG